MAKSDFPGAPDLGADFSRSPGGEIDNTRPDNTPDPVELLDHHDLSIWDYTPGGSVEKEIHQTLSEAGRAAYREATRSVEERDHDEHYQAQLNKAFDRAVTKQSRDVERHERVDRGDDERTAARRALHDQIEHQLGSPTHDFNDAGRGVELDFDR
jgi:hypothetical protein